MGPFILPLKCWPPAVKRWKARPAWCPGSGNVAQYTMEKLLDLGAKPVTCSDSSGYVYDEAGIDRDKLAFLMNLKNVRRGRVREYTEKYPDAVYTEADPEADVNPLWNHKADCAFPSATQNEISARDAQNLVDNGVAVVCEGANMPTVPEGIDIFIENKMLYGPGKAANAGGRVGIRSGDDPELHATWPGPAKRWTTGCR